MFQRNPFDPYIIAEIGMNYEGSMKRAKDMITSVARAGGHAAKFQTYKAETLASKEDSPAYWDTSKERTLSQFELFKKYDSFGADEYAELASHAKAMGIDFLSTPFDLESVNFLDPLVPFYKVASADITNLPLLRSVASKKKPVVISVGAASYEEIEVALSTLEESGATDIAVLHCVLRYPTPENVANLSAIPALSEKFGDRATIGYSDHVAPDADGAVPALHIATMFGARILEKHFTDNRSAPGNDHYHAFDEEGLSRFVRALDRIRDFCGSGIPNLDYQREAISNARRRIFAARDLVAGVVLADDDLVPLRASVGLEVSKWDEAVGSQLKVSKVKGQPICASEI